MSHTGKNTGAEYTQFLAKRIRTLREVLRVVQPRSEREWLDELLQYPDPERRLVQWETIAFAYLAFFEARTPTAKAKDQALRVLLDCTAGRSEREIHKVAYKSLSIAEIKSLIAHYVAARQTVQTISRFKNNRRRR